jgi:hypothetical protein
MVFVDVHFRILPRALKTIATGNQTFKQQPGWEALFRFDPA